MDTMKKAINRDIAQIQNYFPVDLSSEHKLLFGGYPDNNEENSSVYEEEA